MGTRCLTVFNTEKGKEIVVMYRQHDGYPDGHGKELAEFLSGFKLVNGMRGDEPPKFANGMSCLAAQVVAKFKDEPGSIYLYPAGTRDTGEEYIYIVSGEIGQEPIIEIQDSDGLMLAKGTPDEILKFIATPAPEEEES